MRAAVACLLAFGMVVACGSPRTEVVSTRSAVTVPQFGDSDPHDWGRRTPWHYQVHGVDVSKWQGDIDWHRVAASGVSFAFIKATEGGDVADDRFAENWRGARRAGVAAGAYHFYYVCRTADEQADWFIRHAPRDRGALPPVLDMEWNHKSKTCPQRPAPEVVRREMRRFLDRLEDHYKRRPIVYTSVDFYHDNELWRVPGHEFWLRSVAGHPSEIYGSQPWTFWQYTGTGMVAGIGGKADINVFGGNRAEWVRWAATRMQ